MRWLCRALCVDAAEQCRRIRCRQAWRCSDVSRDCARAATGWRMHRLLDALALGWVRQWNDDDARAMCGTQRDRQPLELGDGGMRQRHQCGRQQVTPQQRPRRPARACKTLAGPRFADGAGGGHRARILPGQALARHCDARPHAMPRGVVGHAKRATPSAMPSPIRITPITRSTTRCRASNACRSVPEANTVATSANHAACAADMNNP